MIDEASHHFPGRIEIESLVDPDDLDDLDEPTGFAIALYHDGKRIWRQGLDTSGPLGHRSY